MIASSHRLTHTSLTSTKTSRFSKAILPVVTPVQNKPSPNFLSLLRDCHYTPGVVKKSIHCMRTFAFRLRPHEELMGEIMALAKKHHIRAGIILTCVGSLEQVSLRYANTGKATQLQGHFEIVSLVGTFAEHSGQHIHLSVSDGQGTTTGGHMLSGNKVYTTAEVVVGSLDDVEFEREHDPTYGYAELAVHSKLK